MASVHGTGSGPKEGVRLIVFDFDQTLSCVHVFKLLAGWGQSSGFIVPPPFARSELGQMLKVEELSRTVFKDRGGFAQAAFGGEARVKRLAETLSQLRAHGTELMVCTKGLVGTVNLCLEEVGVLDHFTQVYGRIGGYGNTPYDDQLEREHAGAPPRRLSGRPEQADWLSKEQLISRLMAQRSLLPEQTVLVEDDPEELRRAKQTCRGVFVSQAGGMTEEHFESLLMLASEPCARSPNSLSAANGRRKFCSIL